MRPQGTRACIARGSLLVAVGLLTVGGNVMKRTPLHITIGLLFVLMLPCMALSQRGTWVTDEITSPALAGNLIGDPATRRFGVSLPPSYETCQECRYPVVYVLHGYDQTYRSLAAGFSSTLDRMVDDREIGEAIAVFVDGSSRFRGSFYLSSVTIGDYETYIVRDLVAYVDAHYRTIPERNSRGITGYSMGGYGALYLALKYPDVFSAVVGQGSRCHWEDWWSEYKHYAGDRASEDAENWDEFGELLWRTGEFFAIAAAAVPNPDKPPFFLDRPYELVDGETELIAEVWEKIIEHDAMHAVDRYVAQSIRLNGIKLVHGTADEAVSVGQSRALDRKLTELGIEHEYVEHGGGHIFIEEESLLFLSDHLQFGPAGTPVVESATATPGATEVGQPMPLEIEVVLDAPLATTNTLRTMILDLSALGTSSPLPLGHAGEGRYTGSATVTPPRNGSHILPILAEGQEGDRYVLRTVVVDVYPEGDMVLYEEGPGEGWTIEVSARADADPASSAFVRTGSVAHAITLVKSSLPGLVGYVFDDPSGLDPFGYTHFEFSINGGETSGQDPSILGKKLSDLGFEVQSDTWTLVSIPVAELPLSDSGRLTGILFTGMVKETFYIDDMKLVAEDPPEPTEPTAVEMTEESIVPSAYRLSQNYPNPFNGDTVIHFALPHNGPVELALYNLVGQKVVTLVDGMRPAGAFKAYWDGRDDAGHALASGVYLYCLRAGGQVETRRLVLVR